MILEYLLKTLAIFALLIVAFAGYTAARTGLPASRVIVPTIALPVAVALYLAENSLPVLDGAIHTLLGALVALLAAGAIPYWLGRISLLDGINTSLDRSFARRYGWDVDRAKTNRQTDRR